MTNESSDINDKNYKPLRARDSSSPQYINRYDRVRERILDGPMERTSNTFIERSNHSFSPLRNSGRSRKKSSRGGNSMRDEKLSNASGNATRGILKPSSQSGSIHGSISKQNRASRMRMKDIGPDVGSAGSQRSNQLMDASGSHNVEEYNKDLNDSSHSSPYVPAPRSRYANESLNRVANGGKRSRSIRNRVSLTNSGD